LAKHIRTTVEAPRIVTSTVEAPGGITLKDGRRITGTVVIPDGRVGYGDKQSHALMAGDTVDRVSTDSTAGDRAYEETLQQWDVDPMKRAADVKLAKLFSKNPAVKMFYNPADKTWDVHYLHADENTGVVVPHSKKLTDAQAGNLYEQYQEAQLKKLLQKPQE